MSTTELRQEKDDQIQLALKQTSQLKSGVRSIQTALHEDGEVVDEVNAKIVSNKEIVHKEATELRNTLHQVLAGNRFRRFMFTYIIVAFFVVSIVTRLL